ncbi:MAG: GTPase [Candidatus Pacearchaeota archaeon]|jgi:ribosome-interacting GTPase 1
MTENVEFVKLKRRLEQTSNITEKIGILERMLEIDPSYPFLAMQKKKFREQLDSFKRGNKKRPRSTSSGLYDFKRRTYQGCLLGMVNSGKSTLLSKLTKSTPVISEIPFSTYKPELGLMDFKGVEIQLVEIPAIYDGDSYRGDGKYDFIKQTDLKIMVIKEQNELDTILLELWNKGIMVGEENGPRGLIIYRENAPDSSIPSIKFDFDEEDSGICNIKSEIFKNLNLTRVYVDFPKLSKPLVYNGSDIKVETVREDLQRKNRRLKACYLIESDSNSRLISLDYKLSDGDKIKFQI